MLCPCDRIVPVLTVRAHLCEDHWTWNSTVWIQYTLNANCCVFHIFQFSSLTSTSRLFPCCSLESRVRVPSSSKFLYQLGAFDLPWFGPENCHDFPLLCWLYILASQVDLLFGTVLALMTSSPRLNTERFHCCVTSVLYSVLAALKKIQDREGRHTRPQDYWGQVQFFSFCLQSFYFLVCQ